MCFETLLTVTQVLEKAEYKWFPGSVTAATGISIAEVRETLLEKENTERIKHMRFDVV